MFIRTRCRKYCDLLFSSMHSNLEEWFNMGRVARESEHALFGGMNPEEANLQEPLP